MAILESRSQTGVGWAKESVAIFKLAPRRWLLLALVYVGIFGMLPSLPGLQILAFITILVWPVFIAVAVRLYQNSESNKSENLADILNIVQPKSVSLILLGAVCLGYVVLISLFLNADIQGLALLTNVQSEINETQMALMLDKMGPLLLKLTLLLIPLMMATWFAPMLIAYNHYSVAKAIKSSIAGSLQYMIALATAWLLLTLGIVLLMLVIGVLVGVMSALVPATAQLLLSTVVFACLLLASALMLAFQYVSYRDIFRAATTS
ncbi:MAG: BPSS1780 family membrane protein [Methylophilaceae bacterium]